MSHHDLVKIWLIADTHFNHQMLIDRGFRPTDFQDRIIQNWKEMVGENDIIIHLGDVIFKRQSELFGILTNLPGIKILVKGNHDNKSDEWYRDNGFLIVKEDMTFSSTKGDIVLSHIPVPITEDIFMNIHGHFHDNDHRNREPEIVAMYDTNKHYNLALEHTDYKPVLITDIIYD